MSEKLNFVMLHFDGVDMAFPRDDVLGVTSVSSVWHNETQKPAMGTLAWKEGELPVYALSKEFDLLQSPQPQRRFSVCFTTPDPCDRYALVCDTVELFGAPDDTLVLELPEFMRLRYSPVRGLFRVGDNLALVCTAESMRTFVTMANKQDG